MNRPGYFGGFILILIVSVSSWGLVWDREWSGDPPGVWRPEPDPPGDQTAAPAARHDLGWATAICLCHHRRGRQEGSGRCARTGTFWVHRRIKQVLQTSKPFSSQAVFLVCLSGGLCQSAAAGFCSGHPAGGPQEPQWVEVSGGSRGCWCLN